MADQPPVGVADQRTLTGPPSKMALVIIDASVQLCAWNLTKSEFPLPQAFQAGDQVITRF